MRNVPWVGLVAIVAMFLIPLLPSRLFEGPRTIKHWPRRHVCGNCGLAWSNGHICPAEVPGDALPFRLELRRADTSLRRVELRRPVAPEGTPLDHSGLQRGDVPQDAPLLHIELERSEASESAPQPRSGSQGPDTPEKAPLLRIEVERVDAPQDAPRPSAEIRPRSDDSGSQTGHSFAGPVLAVLLILLGVLTVVALALVLPWYGWLLLVGGLAAGEGLRVMLERRRRPRRPADVSSQGSA
jgi:hypothetical protein